MASGPDHVGDMPSTMISCPRSSIPAELLARPDHRSQRVAMSASLSSALLISPSATAAPKALAAREKPMDLSVSGATTAAPRRAASPMRWAVSSGHLICTEVHITGINDPRILHGRPHPGRHRIDLLQAAKVIEGKLRGVSAA